ncbi:MAG: CRISPR-associated primase-polymerase type A1 [Lachnospiraceae bacterium]|nr:CRISPR-associated primase-polymerase type A1 [Lachnospiraceae bacterium]
MGLYTKIIDLQKLRLAWKQVFRNRPKEGIDQVTCDSFEADKENQLKLLAVQLRDHTYECQPVRLCPLYKGEKVRYISLYCMRDKVVQLSIANELSNIYEKSFPDCSYAYRSGKSALNAGNDIVQFIKKSSGEKPGDKKTGDGYVLRTDIHSFFDSIPHGKLISVLRGRVREDDVLDLIKGILRAPSLEKDGTLTGKRVGVYQGSSFAPVLSNIYLLSLDQKIQEEVSFYVRYSDDMLLFFETREQAEAYKGRLKRYLENLGLEMSEEKTKVVKISDGLDYLGFHFDQTGMSVPEKARIELNERLEAAWLDSGASTFEKRMQKASEIVTGWDQYFSLEETSIAVLSGKPLSGILEFTVRIYQMQKKRAIDLAKARAMRKGLENPYRDVAEYLIRFWSSHNQPVPCLREYESYYEMPDVWKEELTEQVTPFFRELLQLYEKYFAHETDETRMEIAQIYTDLKKYRNAAALTEAYSKTGRRGWMVESEKAKASDASSMFEEESKNAGNMENAERAEQAESMTVARRTEHARSMMGAERAEHARSVMGTEKAEYAGDTESAGKVRNSGKTEGVAHAKEVEKAEKTESSEIIRYAVKSENAENIESAGNVEVAEEDADTASETSMAEFSSDSVIHFSEKSVRLSADELERYMELFTGREDIYALNELSDNNRRICVEVPEPLQPEVVKAHLKGTTTVSTFVQRSNATVKFLVIDLDVSKGVLLGRTEEIIKEYMKKCFELATLCFRELSHLGIHSHIEDSGCRGYHVWILFDGWIQVRYVNLLADIIETKLRPYLKDSGIQAEYFPNKTKIRNGKAGQCIKLPWGIHPKTGRRSYFLKEDGTLYSPQHIVLDEIIPCTLNTIKRALAANRPQDGGTAGIVQTSEVDRDISEFGPLPDTVRVVLENCALMRYLCQKARKTHYLSHFERLSILYVFGHLGEDGQDFIHKVMSFTLNYSEFTTQRFIQRCPEKPISCVKLRDQYKQVTAEIGCACNFKRTKNCYPSPVLHALKKAEENTSVTMPLSRTVPADKQSILKNEINVTARVQEIAEKLIEVRKQRRSLEKTARKYEQELTVLFDENKTDSMEIKMGLLIRRKTDDRVEWSIEL